jgi:hypothetical protein
MIYRNSQAAEQFPNGSSPVFVRISKCLDDTTNSRKRDRWIDTCVALRVDFVISLAIVLGNFIAAAAHIVIMTRRGKNLLRCYFLGSKEKWSGIK